MADPVFSLVVPAAGLGKRMKAAIPKPYLDLGGQPLLEHTLKCFAGITGLSQVIVSTAPRFFEQTQKLLTEIFTGIDCLVVEGGKERQDSIYNALQRVNEAVDLVAVHDAVRPFVSKSTIIKCLEMAAAGEGAILGVPVKDTIKKVDRENVIKYTPARSDLWQAQTPQIFDRQMLLKAYENAMQQNIVGTDDASLVEATGGSICIVEGTRDNFKLTYPLDFKIAEMLVSESKSNQRK